MSYTDGLPARYDAWRTASPYDELMPRCGNCGGDYDDHIDVSDEGEVAAKQKQALEAIDAIVNAHAECKNRMVQWTLEEIVAYGLSASRVRGVECKEYAED